jgi:hypothetical protein
MTKFMQMVEQNLPESSLQADLDLIMDCKSVVNELNSRKKCNFKIEPIRGPRGEGGTIVLKHDDGRSCVLYLKANEEAEDPAMMKQPSASAALVSDIIGKNPEVQTAAKLAAINLKRKFEEIGRS